MNSILHKFQLVSCLLVFSCIPFIPAQSKELSAEAFANPPASTKPWLYWYWISDHISKEGITNDLEAMASVGIGEAMIGNIDEIKQKGNIKALSEPWHEMLDHAIREGKRTGVDIGLFNSPGWSQSGGPWNKPEHSMRYLVMSETSVKGPQLVTTKLPQPTEQFQDVRVIAFQRPAADTDNFAAQAAISTHPAVEGTNRWSDGNIVDELMCPANSENQFTITLELQLPRTLRSLILHPAKSSFKAECELQSKNADGIFTRVKAFTINRTNNSTSVGFIPYAPIVETLTATTSNAFRLVFTSISGKMGFTEIIGSAAARTARYPEKQLAKLWPTPAPQWDAYKWEPQPELNDPTLVINPQKVVDLSRYLQPDGSFHWNAPEGDWVIQRIGMTSTGQRNAPASVEATGLEVDKMNREWVARHFEAYSGKIIKRLPAGERTALKHIVADSYETGGQNWTDDMAADFQKTYGYDPIPYLPVFFGRVVQSAEISDRFLWDVRRMIADRISHQYVGTMRQKANEYGLQLWLENYGHWGYPGEFLQYGGQSDAIGGEFWTGNDIEGMELRAASSAAHGYGKNIVHAEAFTSGGPMWNYHPGNLKRLGDWAATKGVNHFVLHVYIHQPYDTMIPGINAWFGVEFNRHNTWFSQSKTWIDYLRRSHYVLQQGKYVADVAYFIGEDAPKMTGIRHPELPEGYNFDYVNAEIIQRMKIVNGRFVLPDGMSYKLLVLPPQTTMQPETLQKIENLVADGGILVGPAPQRAPGLKNYPQSDIRIQELAAKIWQNTSKTANYGKGRVYTASSLTEIFAELNLAPALSSVDRLKLPWIHRSTGDSEIYFLSNQTDELIQISPSFRVDGKQPQLWHPVSGQLRTLPEYTCSNGLSTVPLIFQPGEAYFIVFRNKAQTPPAESRVNFTPKKSVYQVRGSWSVTFDPAKRGPGEVRFDSLTDWSTHPDNRIKHYSGTAIYRKNFDFPAFRSNQKMYLDLGKYSALARVTLNGSQLDLFWTENQQVEITGLLKRTNNRIEIEVTNTWHNRLTGDAALPENERLTSAILSPDKNAALSPSGLVGPVRIMKEVEDFL